MLGTKGFALGLQIFCTESDISHDNKNSLFIYQYFLFFLDNFMC